MKCILLYIVAALLTTGCNDNSKEPSPPGYDLEQPDKFNLPESLLEVSGIAFHAGKADTVYAIQDEEGKLFSLPWKVKKQTHTKFAKKGDYEDLALLNDKVVVLKSNGTLYTFPFAERHFPETDSTREWKDLLPPGEYESLFADVKENLLYVLCKNCSGDKTSGKVSGYILQCLDSVITTGQFFIDEKQLETVSGKVKRGFRPSALARHPLTNEWYIVSAVNKLLVIADAQWNVKAAYPLNGNRFNQPEGIAFDGNGNLYISNEGDDLTNGNILRFVWQPLKK
ncbi:SdiA-regulated domain-containing protein [Nostoc ellipsosporum NOK]|nr:SdiA-regulated domain-containing protein [Nostoc ellipsosporum NOK]